MAKHILYCMEPETLKTYINHKNNIQQASLELSEEKISLIKSEVSNFSAGDGPKNYSVDGETAFIAISGPLEPKRDICAVLFDIEMTTYSDIIDSINLAENDDAVKNIHFIVNSPGGNVTGLTKTAEVIKNAKKPTTAIVEDMAASAAYWLASQADTIIVETESSEVGSIGVYSQYVDRTEEQKQAGIRVMSFRSKNAPLKNVDPSTEKGEDLIIERMTKMESVFFGYIASGRHTTVENIAENYGQGGLLMASEALKMGMIDKIEMSLNVSDTPTEKNNNINPNSSEEDIVSEKLEMTQEQFDSAISKAANSAAEKTAKLNAEATEKKVKDMEANTARVAGFNSLLASFPNQSEMIKTEIEKGNSATADFAMKVSESEATRVAVEKEHGKSADDSAPVVKATEDKEVDSELNAMANMCIKGRV